MKRRSATFEESDIQIWTGPTIESVGVRVGEDWWTGGKVCPTQETSSCLNPSLGRYIVVAKLARCWSGTATSIGRMSSGTLGTPQRA